jgi:hypothetical protein
VSTPATTASYLIDLKLARPAATQEFIHSYRESEIPVNFFSWQLLAADDAVLLNGTRPALVAGGWLLAALAVCCVAGLVAGRAARQVRRVGLLKAVGAGPGLVTAVLLAEYVILALVASGLGLTIGWLLSPTLSDPSSGLVDSTPAPTGGTVGAVIFLALAVAILATLGPAVRAARTSTVHALADTAQVPRHRAAPTPTRLRLPAPLLLGLRLIARRPGRAHRCRHDDHVHHDHRAARPQGTAPRGIQPGRLHPDQPARSGGRPDSAVHHTGHGRPGGGQHHRHHLGVPPRTPGTRWRWPALPGRPRHRSSAGCASPNWCPRCPVSSSASRWGWHCGGS